MNFIKKFKIIYLFSFILNSFVYSNENKVEIVTKQEKLNLKIIVGSNRETQTGLKIAKNIEKMIKDFEFLNLEILYLNDYEFSFYRNATPPAMFKGTIENSELKRWSDKINEGDAFIIVSPEYNSGYTAPLKNALDSLYLEWNNKPVSIVGYSGGEAGGANMIKQLEEVLKALKMIVIKENIKIPFSWKALDENDKLVDFELIKEKINAIVSELIKEIK